MVAEREEIVLHDQIGNKAGFTFVTDADNNIHALLNARYDAPQKPDVIPIDLERFFRHRGERETYDVTAPAKIERLLMSCRTGRLTSWVREGNGKAQKARSKVQFAQA